MLGEPIWLALGASLLAFSFYNGRKKARCFMGDVWAVSLAFGLGGSKCRVGVDTALYSKTGVTQMLRDS